MINRWLHKKLNRSIQSKLRIAVLTIWVATLVGLESVAPAKAQDLPIVWDDSHGLEQTTNVSQLRNSSPGDWTYEALQNIVKRYGCIFSYPYQRERDKQPMTRYEFAASLNICLQQIERLLQENVTILHEDIKKLQRLEKEFEAELADLGARLDNLEGHVAFLEEGQFSTTTKLFGNISLSGLAYFSGEGAKQAVFQHQTYIGLSTSFTGRDMLSTGLLASNSELPELAPSNQGRAVGSTREGLTTWAYGGNTNNNLVIGNLEYTFPVFDNEKEELYVTLAISNGFNTSRFLRPKGVLTWEGYEQGSGPVSAFGQRNPTYRLGGGAGAIVSYARGSWELTTAYLATQANDPSSGAGLFNGDYLALAQLNFTPSDRFALALVYSHNKFGDGRFAFNSQYQFNDADSPGFVGTALANRFDNTGVFFDENVPVVSNSYGVQTFYQVSSRLVLGGFASKINARLIGRGDGDILTYGLSLAFPDLGKEGNLGGLIVGVEPTLTGLDAVGVSSEDFKRDTSLHVEAFYKYQVNDNISITPGVIVVTAPNQDANNQDIVLGLIRTTFSF